VGLDKKYGRVTIERGDVGEDEPVVIFRGKDVSLPKLLGLYWNMCEKIGSPKHHLDLINQRIDEICEWQDAHPELVHIPNSDGFEDCLERPARPVGVPQGEEVE
jgi:hypothetical protein